MPKLEPYHRNLSYSYAPGLFPSMACLTACPERCQRLIYSTKLRKTDDVQALFDRCAANGIRTETADRMLERLSRKENCYAAMVYEKAEGSFESGSHVVLHEPSDAGNMGTILRTALGLGFRNIAIIRPAVDSDDPKVIRASMGASFSLHIRHFDNFDAYYGEYRSHHMYPFMLDASIPLPEAIASLKAEPISLIFGNEAAGLPGCFSLLGTPVRIPHNDLIDSLNLAIAAGIGMYAFGEKIRNLQ